MNVRKTNKDDLEDIYKIINNVKFKEDLFIKSSREEINSKLSTSYVCIYRGLIVGVCLINDTYIDTIVSIRKGAGSILLKNLPKGYYYTNISELNNKSKRLFAKFNFKEVGKERIKGKERLRFEAIL